MTETEPADPALKADGAATPRLSRRQHRRVIIASVSGTVIEWYDFTLYAVASSLIFGPEFFPGAGPIGSVLASFGTFAIGLAVRPLGGLLFAHYGDRVGRKPIMLTTVLVMGLSTTLIGVLPTAAQAGALGAWLLVLMRVLQGLGVGAEFAGAVTMLNESSPESKRGFSSGFASAANYAGTTIATVTFALLGLLPDDVLQGWAWRIPFLATIVVVLVAVYVRTKVEETAAFQSAVQRKVIKRLPLGNVIREKPRELLCMAAIYCFIIPWSYTIQTFGLTYLTSTVKLPKEVALTCLVIGYVVLMPGMVFSGILVDRFGPKKLMLWGCAGGAVFAFPVFFGMNSGSPVLTTIVVICGLMVSQGLPSAASSVIVTRALRTEYRWSGITVCREIPAAVVGGTAPLVSVGLLTLGDGRPWYIATYLVVLTGLGLLGVLAMPKSVYQRKTTGEAAPIL
ncbi:MFS transporter [Amycolatopsis sp. CA-161197]|uniref:MFS transporter n=1 Tax=unclassified Amycolatopsis TaxID=2618356 RepID=UPI0034527977